MMARPPTVAGTAIWTISVVPVNVAPTLEPDQEPASVIESNVEQLITVPLSGITARRRQYDAELDDPGGRATTRR